MSFSSCIAPDPLYKGETAIVGKVRKGAAPVAGAYIRLLDATKNFVGEVTSDDEGKFHFFAAAGEWTLVCLAPGAVRAQHEVELSRGDELEVEFSFE